MNRAPAEIVLTGLEAPEGPILLGHEDIAFVEQLTGQISRINGGGLAVVARAPGAFNAIALGADGLLYAAQNGGAVGDWRSDTPGTPSIQRISLEGDIEVVGLEADRTPLRAPNDLVFGPDNRLYVTDPSEPFAPHDPRADARICVFGAEGGRTFMPVGRSYPNGLAFLDDNRLCWVESYTRRVRVRDSEGMASTLAVLPEGEIPDGIAVADDGRIFIASVTSGGVTVLGPDGECLGLMHLDERAHPTNLCFDEGSLWVTDFGAGFQPGAGDGRLWRVETDARPRRIYAGSLP
ncbi:gluconolactonase [Microbacterium trichothecenolyticum]|uniref:SMP-30/gluconolactonase/LRE family protein n=1 Tax=Microbacterium trichothecenolyticum TaxID=69370 RepID=UPI00285D49B6|nr:SMP-30/gluconolactonase/LRE family protein [Microbacterium trichothecenolyticum]MDR7187099.1 gluconolactonase [Microbacterium trichothecenolyticum]